MPGSHEANLFPEGISKTSSCLPESLKFPNLYLYLIQGKAQQPGAKGTELRQGRLLGSSYSLHPLRVSKRLLCTKEQKREAQLWITCLPLAPTSSKQPRRGSCLQQTCLAQVGSRAPQRWRPSSNFWTSQDYSRPCHPDSNPPRSPTSSNPSES